MSKPMATTLPWRTRLPERIPIPGIETKSPVERPGFLFGGWRSHEVRHFDSMAHLKEAHLKERRAISVDPCGEEPVPAKHQGRPSSGRSNSATLATSVQKLLDITKRRKFSMPSSPVILFLIRRRLSLESVPAIRICGADLP
jgi:hypothetical protein